MTTDYRTNTMRIGLQIPYLTWAGGPDALGETFAAIAQRAEACGFS